MLDIEDVSSISGEGSMLSFALSYYSDVDDTYEVTPVSTTGKIRILAQIMEADKTTEIDRTDRTYSHIDTNSRIAYVTISDLFKSNPAAAILRLIVDITPGDGVARTVNIENLRVNRGAYPATFRYREDSVTFNQGIDIDLTVAGTYQPVYNSDVAKAINSVVVTGRLDTEAFIRGYKEIKPAVPGTYTMDITAGTPSTITFTLADDMTITYDSNTGISTTLIKDVFYSK
jgi:hypothetical protein